MPATYLDASAIVKLAVREAESNELRRYLRRRRPLVSSALARTEVLRALLPSGDAAVRRGRDALSRLDLIRVNDRILGAAGILFRPTFGRWTRSISLPLNNSAAT